MNAHTILEIGAWTFGLLAVLLLTGGFVLGPAGENLGGRLYARESDRLEEQERARKLAEQTVATPGIVTEPVKPKRIGLGERVTRAAYWLAVKVLRLDKQGAGQ